MATVSTRSAEDEELFRLQQQAEQGGGPQLSTGLGGGGAGGVDAMGGPSGVTPQRGGAPQVTLDRYLAANRGAVDALGSKVEGVVTGAGTQARSAIGQGVQSFDQGVAGGTVTDMRDLIARVGLNPVGIFDNQADRDQLIKQRDASYTGPRALEETAGYSDISRRLAEARSVGELTRSESGVGELSDRAVTGARSVGGRELDSQLLRADEGLRGRLDTARQGIEGLDQELGQASTTAQARAVAGQQTTAQTRDRTRGALVTAQDALQKQLDERVAIGRQQAQQRATEALGALQGNKGAIPTAGAAGRYYADNNPRQGGFEDRAATAQGPQDPAFNKALAAYWATPAGKAALDATLATPEGKAQFAASMQAQDVPEFIHNTSGQQALGGFDQYIAGQQASRGEGVSDRALADLGISREQYNRLFDLAPVQDAAHASAFGTSNVNPYSFAEDYYGRLGDLSKYATVQNPDAVINRENTATQDDYYRAGALEQLGGAGIGRRLLDYNQFGRAGTADAASDLVSFDLRNAGAQREAALDAISQRQGAHVAGNARSGGDPWLQKIAATLKVPLENPFSTEAALVTFAPWAVPIHAAQQDTRGEARENIWNDDYQEK